MRETAAITINTTFCILMLSCVSAAQSTDIATVMVHVTSAPSQAENEKVLKLEMVQGKPSIQIGEAEDGQVVATTVGTYVFLRFDTASGARGFEVHPPGILVTPPGVYNMPRGVVGLLRAERPGMTTITIKGVSGRRFSGGGTPNGQNNPIWSGHAIQAGPCLPPSCSGNWSGYAITGGPFTSISGEWTVPVATGDSGSSSVSWIGIDGDGNTSLIQTGTEQDWNSGFLGIGAGPSYYAWWEILPALQTTFSDPVSPGDLMVAKIAATGPTAPGKPQTWVIVLSDLTQHWGELVKESYSGPLDTAEWIEEAPTQCNPFSCFVTSLADYGVVQFDGQDFLNSGSPDLTASESITMVQGGETVSSPSNPDADLDGFSLAFGGITPLPPGPFIVTTDVPGAYVNDPYQVALQATDFNFSANASGTVTCCNWFASGLPSWLSLNESTGLLSGTPTSLGSFPFSVTAVNTANPLEHSQVQPLTLTVVPGPPPPPAQDFSLSASPQVIGPPGTQGRPIVITVHPINGFTGSVAFSASDLPAGWTASFNPPSTTTTSTLGLAPAGRLQGALVTVIGRSGALTHQVGVLIEGPPIKPPSN